MNRDIPRKTKRSKTSAELSEEKRQADPSATIRGGAKYRAFVDALDSELIPAMGCTEPIAVAYASAIARETLGEVPASIAAIVSGNIVKNVNSVVVPNTGGMKGVRASVAAGAAAGDASARLEVLSSVDDAGRRAIRAFLSERTIDVAIADVPEPFYIEIRAQGACGDAARVVMRHSHTHIARIERNGKTLVANDENEVAAEIEGVKENFTLRDIIAFADAVDLDDVRSVLDRQISFNYAIAQEGLSGDWGANVGRTYLAQYDSHDVFVRAKAAAAAGSDARMNGCPMPVVIVSGSGNQGITASVPLVVYARELGRTHEELLRALIVSDLISIYQKSGIGCLSAYCGAICAGTGAVSGIVYLLGGRMEEIEHTIVNSLGIISGMVCDGAKSSCAAKISLALESGMLGYRMYNCGNQFLAGDGILASGVDATIANVSRMAREGMRQTDSEILDIMIGR